MNKHTAPINSFNKDILYRILADAELGAGNFLYKTCQYSSNLNTPFIHLELPYSSAVNGNITTFSLQTLKTEAELWARFYTANNIGPKDVVGVFTRDSVEYLIHYIALTSLGAVPALVNSYLSADILVQYFDNIGARLVLADCDRFNQLMCHYTLDFTFELCDLDSLKAGDFSAALPEVFPFHHYQTDPVLLSHTSGTTGIPKSVISCHKNYLHGVIHRLKNPTPDLDRYFSALPHSHNSGIAYLMEAIIRGCEVYIKSRKSPASMAEGIELFKPNFVVAFPKIFVDMCYADLQTDKLQSVFYWRSTGDAAHERHVREITRWGSRRDGSGNITRGSIYIDGLGSSEMGSSLFVVYHDQHKRNYNRVVGKPQPWVDAKVLDAYGRELPNGQVGRLGVKTPSLTLGYWNNSVVSEQFRANGYWITGDLVFKTEYGEICHVDRITDAIYLPNRVVYSLLTEEIVMKKFTNIFDCSVYKAEANGEAQAHIKVRYLGQQPEASALLEEINLWLEMENMPPLDKLSFYSAQEAIPEGVTGKVLKRELRAVVA